MLAAGAGRGGPDEGNQQTRELGALIKRTRRASGLSQVKVAERLGVSYQQVQKYEKGATELTVRRLRQLSEIFGVPPGAFLGEKGGPGLLSEEEREALMLFRRIGRGRMRRVALEILWLLAEGGKGAGDRGTGDRSAAA